MIKMIIVDDEYIILDSLKTLVDWASIDVEIVGTADNGAAAMELTLKQKPDIILSDISMPFFSGLEMLETLRRYNLSVEVIFISAYSKFEYARDAIRHGVFDYILKPINEELLLQTVSRCTAKIRAEKKQRRFEKENSLETIRWRDGLFLRCFFHSTAPSQEEWEKLRKIEPELETYPQAALVAVRHEPAPAAPFDTVAFPPWGRFFTLYAAADQTLFLLCMRPWAEERTMVRQWITAALSAMPACGSVAVSNPGTLSSCFERAYAEVSFTLMAAQITGKRPGSAGDKPLFFTDIRQAGIARFPGFDTILRSLDLNIRNGSSEDIPELIYAFFQGFLEKGIFYDLDLTELYCIELIDHVLREEEDYINPEGLNTIEIKKNITSCTSLEQVFTVTRDILKNFCLRIVESQAAGKTRFVRLTLKFIHEHYGEDISLHQAAKQLYISPNYLSRIFSAEMGESFSRHLLNYRIEQGKKLLRETYDKVYEIADKVGYADVVHFSKVFKQVTGMPPNRYRNGKKQA
jgi:two-component system response regulator YesN